MKRVIPSLVTLHDRFHSPAHSWSEFWTSVGVEQRSIAVSEFGLRRSMDSFGVAIRHFSPSPRFNRRRLGIHPTSPARFPRSVVNGRSLGARGIELLIRCASSSDDRSPFDLNLAVVLAGFAFEAYSNPPVVNRHSFFWFYFDHLRSSSSFFSLTEVCIFIFLDGTGERGVAWVWRSWLWDSIFIRVCFQCRV